MKKPVLVGLTASQAHATMDLWAAKHNWNSITLVAEFPDGSQFTEEVPRATKSVTYKVDGELYEVEVPTNKYVDAVFGELPKTRMLEAFRKFCKDHTKAYIR